ncbi:ESX secretion-associated protein EspG [Nocardia sp. NPDC058176]|uniref:ESX secretion-associated protein EspG n=1 Tax=Nocardia sp. NPDC058176 TaxID=3346368 RepID=UPI0036D76304
MRWEFTPDEFMYVWGEIGADRIPAPLVVVPSVRWRDEWDALVANLRQHLSVRDDPDLSAVLHLAASPDTAITVIGTRGDPIRLYCAVIQQSAVALAQMPGSTAEVGGNVVIRTGTAESVVSWVARFAGDRPAGSTPKMTESVDVLHSPAQALGLDYGEVSTTDRMHELLTTPRSGQGHIEVVRGHHGDDPARRYLSWFDAEGDGRYVYRYGRGLLAVEPCSSARFDRIVSRLIGPS